MNPDQKNIEGEISSQAIGGQYGVVPVPYHTHNGTDSVPLNPATVLFPYTTGTPASPMANGYRTIYNDGVHYWLYTYVNNTWVTQQLGITSGTTATVGKFGGTGADGSLTVSGTVATINLGGVALVEKNYTSISITGTGIVNFSNPNANGTIVVLKSQGNVTITSGTTPCLDARSVGSAGGAGGNGVAAGTDAQNANGSLFATGGGKGGTSSGGGGNVAGAGGTKPTSYSFQIYKGFFVSVGAGGGGGGGGVNQTGNGGDGGGGLVIECGGALNFTTTNGISVAGKQGVAGSATHASGGGGGAGSCYILYTTLTANTGTIDVSGGASATGAVTGDNAGGCGGGGAGTTANGTTGNMATGASGSGGAGYSLVTQNTEFA